PPPRGPRPRPRRRPRSPGPGSGRSGSAARGTSWAGSRGRPPADGGRRPPGAHQASLQWKTPDGSGARSRKASGERSMIRPPNGPRSLITTVTDRPFARFVTVTFVPNGSHGLAAVRPGWPVSYHVASPYRTWAPGGDGRPAALA